MEHGLQISLIRYAPSAEDKMEAGAFGRAANYGWYGSFCWHGTRKSDSKHQKNSTIILFYKAVHDCTDSFVATKACLVLSFSVTKAIRLKKKKVKKIRKKKRKKNPDNSFNPWHVRWFQLWITIFFYRIKKENENCLLTNWFCLIKWRPNSGYTRHSFTRLKEVAHGSAPGNWWASYQSRVVP